MDRKPTEKEIEVSIIKYLNAKGYWCRKNYDQAKIINGSYQKDPWAAKGIADLLVIIPNHVIFLEVKTKTGRQSQDQINFEQVCDENSITYAVVTSAKEALAVVESKIAV